MNRVDLHTHTTESDGTFTPRELVEAAAEAGLKTLAITDHDTFSAFDLAAPLAEKLGVRLVRGIEVTTKEGPRNVHLLGYFFAGPAGARFDSWLEHQLQGRRERNERLAARLREIGLNVEVAEAEKYGRRLTGRPHFARVLVDKGYVHTVREAFDRYIGESGDAYVEREAPGVETAVSEIRAAGGIVSLAHPIRLMAPSPEAEEKLIAGFVEAGLPAIEAFHSDHGASDVERYLAIAAKYELAVSGGSDFHGTHRVGVELGRINGGREIPEWILPALEERSH